MKKTFILIFLLALTSSCALQPSQQEAPIKVAVTGSHDYGSAGIQDAAEMERLGSAQKIARLEAEISKNIDAYNRQSNVTQITPSTHSIGYAVYYKAVQNRIEKLGTLHFPNKNGEKLYGKLVVYIPIFQDGSIYRKEGGPRVERSSGNADLDSAALDIIERSAPFSRFPESLRSVGKKDVWEIISTLEFTRDGELSLSLR